MKRGGRGRIPGRTATRRARRRPGSARTSRPDLIETLGRGLATGEPLGLLSLVSGIMAALDARSRGPFREASSGAEASGTLRELVQTAADLDRIEAAALLAAVAELTPDELLRAEARRHLAGRGHVLPEWLRDLGSVAVYRCVEMVHVLGDGDDLILAVRLAGGHQLSMLVYVDHNLGTAVKDAFVVPKPIDEMVTMMRQHQELPPNLEWRDLDLADARARITQAIEMGAMMLPPLESDTWPVCRALVEWAVRQLPEGGTGYQRPEWDEARREALTESFFGSSFGRGLDDNDRRNLFDLILSFGTDYGPGDPLRWSPTAVEILLVDWIPRKVLGSISFLSKAPELLRAVVRYAHHERGIPTELTEETLAEVDKAEREYGQIIRSPHPQGPAALLAALGQLPQEGSAATLGGAGLGATPDSRQLMRKLLLGAVGGERALRSLTADPLPDEPFKWDGIPQEIRAKVGEILEGCDRCCEQLLDLEYRTACRRYLARVTTGDPEVLRRRGRADTAAAAVCWTVGQANELFSTYDGGMRAKDLLAHFGLAQGSVSQRAATLMAAAGVGPNRDDWPAREIALGTPELLVAARRLQIIEDRDRFLGDGL